MMERVTVDVLVIPKGNLRWKEKGDLGSDNPLSRDSGGKIMKAITELNSKIYQHLLEYLI